jgi:hypothetical protein
MTAITTFFRRGSNAADGKAATAGNSRSSMITAGEQLRRLGSSEPKLSNISAKTGRTKMSRTLTQMIASEMTTIG